MRISATGNRRLPHDAGVTLVEAMVALMVIGLIVGAVVLMAPGPASKTRLAAEQLAARMVLASEESVIGNRPISLVVTYEGYGFERLEESGWIPLEHGSPLGFSAWPADMEVRIEPAADETRVARFDALGGATPVSIVMSGAGARWRVSVDGQGGIDVAQGE